MHSSTLAWDDPCEFMIASRTGNLAEVLAFAALRLPPLATANECENLGLVSTMPAHKAA